MAGTVRGCAVRRMMVCRLTWPFRRPCGTENDKGLAGYICDAQQGRTCGLAAMLSLSLPSSHTCLHRCQRLSDSSHTNLRVKLPSLSQTRPMSSMT